MLVEAGDQCIEGRECCGGLCEQGQDVWREVEQVLLHVSVKKGCGGVEAVWLGSIASAW